jgi:hypothetical protein
MYPLNPKQQIRIGLPVMYTQQSAFLRGLAKDMLLASSDELYRQQ